MQTSPTILLDGSMGHELKKRLRVSTNSEADNFATAMRANTERPELVTAIHRDYIAAGCDVITTNSFTLTPTADQAGELPALLHAACRCASAAAVDCGRQVRIAGCLPPLNHCYLPELVPAAHEMLQMYEQIVKELAPRVDLFLAETLCSTAEARATVQAAGASGKPCWLSLTLHDDVAEPIHSPPTLRTSRLLWK